MTTTHPTTQDDGPGRSARTTAPARSVRVPDDIWAAAKAKAASRHETVSDVILRALREYAVPPPLTRTVSAIPCGKDEAGDPIRRRYLYTLVREPEPFGEHDGRATSRLWQKDRAAAQHGLDRVSPGPVVWTDSIQDVDPDHDDTKDGPA